MYNLYKYQADVQIQESARASEEQYTKWLIKHQEIKNRAAEKLNQKIDKFIHHQESNPVIHEDDHYKTWRYLRQHRDIEDQKKFLGFKAFQHKPSHEMNKYYNERQRKEIEYLANKSKKLVEDNIIHHHHVSRSLLSQSPHRPKHSFREKKKDHEYLQPRMRYTNITDKDRILQNSYTYDDKFSRLYQSFHSSKSRIGQTKVSPTKPISKSANVDMIQSTYSELAKDQKYHFERLNDEEQKHTSKQLRSNSEDSIQKMRKTYFKSAKTRSIYGDKRAKQLMIKTQYDRQKDLTNLQSNLTHQNFNKRPIL